VIELYTIGFTQKTAERFFGLLRENQVDVLVDIRRRPEGQLAGFAKKADLPFFMKQLVGGEYLHLPVLAPDDDLLTWYRKSKDWQEFETRFNAQMDQEDVPAVLDKSIFATHRCCLLCSEAKPEHCHRTFVAERLAKNWGNVTIRHLA